MPPFVEDVKTCFANHKRFVEALETIADIAEGSQTINSLPHIAKIAREALSLTSAHREGEA